MEFYSIEELARCLGNERSLDARTIQVHRALQAGAFPGARKVNPDKETSPWVIPREEGDAWLQKS